MSIISSRGLHTARRLLNVNDLRQVVTEVPKVSGLGPFAESAKFQVIGPQASLVHVTLPASATIYARRGAIVGVTGELGDVRSELATGQPLTKLARSLPVVFQRVTSVSPVSLLVSAKSSTTSTYAVVPVSKEYDWIVTQRKALLGWTGSAVVEPYSTLRQWGNVRVAHGGGGSSNSDQVALVGDGQIFQLEVAKDETVFVNTTNVIAYTKPLHEHKRAIVRLPHSKATFELPEFAWLNLPTWNVPVWIRKIGTWVKAATTRVLWRDDVALSVTGPRTVLIQTRGSQLGHVFDKHELKEIVNKTHE